MIALDKTQHPLSSAFPAMEKEAYRLLVEDIVSHGQRDTATICDGMVIDGWHRYKACQELGIPCRFEEFQGVDAVAFVRSKNQHRRHYQKSQQAAIEVSLTVWAEAHRPIKGEAASPLMQHGYSNKGEAASPLLQHGYSSPASTNKEMADRAGTTERTIQHAKRAHEAGLGDAVRDGKLSAERAAGIAKANPELAKQVARGEKTLPEAVAELSGKRQGQKGNSEPAPIEDEMALMNTEILKDVIDALGDDNNDLRNQLAAKLFEGAEEEKSDLLNRLTELTKINKELGILNRALVVSRDTTMRENASLRKQCEALARMAKKAA